MGRVLYKRISIVLVGFVLTVLTIVSGFGCTNIFSSRKYTVDYDLGGIVKLDDISIKNGKRLQLPKVEDTDEYKFGGWYFDDTFLNECSETIVVSKTLTVFAKWYVDYGDWRLSPINDNTAFKVSSYLGDDVYLTIPSSYKNKKVTTIGAKFLDSYVKPKSGLTHANSTHGVLILENIQRIESRAFFGTWQIEELAIPKSVEYIGSKAFACAETEDDVKAYRVERERCGYPTPGIMRKYLYVFGDPEIEKDTLYDPNGSFAIASVIADKKSAIYRQYANVFAKDKNDRHVKYNRDVIDAVGIVDNPRTPPRQLVFDDFDGVAHETYYERLETGGRVLDAVNASMLLSNLRFGYASKVATDSNAEKVILKAKAALNQIVRPQFTDYQKVKAIYNYVTSINAYDHSLGTAFNENNWLHASYNLEGIFLNGVSVCDGISKAIELLCRMEGITAYRVFGAVDNGGSGKDRWGGHAWNKILVNGQWYLCDATWGDVKTNERDYDLESGISKPNCEASTPFYMLASGTDDGRYIEQPFVGKFTTEATYQDDGMYPTSSEESYPLYFRKETSNDESLILSDQQSVRKFLIKNKADFEELKVKTVFITNNLAGSALCKDLNVNSNTWRFEPSINYLTKNWSVTFGIVEIGKGVVRIVPRAKPIVFTPIPPISAVPTV